MEGGSSTLARPRHWPPKLWPAAVCALTLSFAGCGKPDDQIRKQVLSIGTSTLRRESGRLNRDYFAVRGLEFVTLKESQWPKPFSELKPSRITVYRDGTAIALGGATGSTEWGIFVVPSGLTYIPPSTKLIHYELISDGVCTYRNLP